MTFDIRFKRRSNIIIGGASGSGKTTFVKNLLSLRDDLLEVNPDRVFLFYSNKQDIYDEMLRQGLIDEIIDVNENFPNLNYLTQICEPFKSGNGSLVIFDDIMSDMTSDFTKIFCNFSHHENASIILMTQNIFYDDKHFRNVTRNAHYYVLLNHRDVQQISSLGRQICPSDPNYLTNAFMEATNRPYNYIILDFRVDSPQEIRVRSNIFPNQFPVRVYVKK